MHTPHTSATHPSASPAVIAAALEATAPTCDYCTDQRTTVIGGISFCATSAQAIGPSLALLLSAVADQGEADTISQLWGEDQHTDLMEYMLRLSSKVDIVYREEEYGPTGWSYANDCETYSTVTVEYWSIDGQEFCTTPDETEHAFETAYGPRMLAAVMVTG